MGMAKPKVDLSTLSLEGDKVDLDSSGPDGAYRQLEGPPGLKPECTLLQRGFYSGGLSAFYGIMTRRLSGALLYPLRIFDGSLFRVQAVIRLGRESLVGTSSLSVIKLSMVDAGGFLFHGGELVLELCGRLA
ncbi:hypothetical protein YC2023_075374 [Brassica napus]